MVSTVHVSNNDTNTEFMEQYGRYNQMYPNMKEISADEFSSHTIFTYGFDFVDYRQILSENLSPEFKNKGYGFMAGHALINKFFGKGVFITKVNDEAKFFALTKCEHTYTEKNLSMCLHEYTCTKCGFTYEVDSSD